MWSGLSSFHWPIWPSNKGRAAEDADGWAPFNGPNGKALLGDVDLAFLGAYAVGIFFAGGSAQWLCEACACLQLIAVDVHIMVYDL